MSSNTEAAATNVPPPSNKKRRVLLPLAIVIAIGAIWYGAHWWQEGRFLEETDDAYVGGDITVITAKVPGYIEQVLVSDNQVVHAGDVLARLDDRDYRAALANAEGAVAAAQAALANLEATRALQQAVIAQAHAGLAASSAETTRAREDQLRYQNLASKAAVSQQSAQKANADYQQALAGDKKNQAQVLAAERELDVIATRKQQAEAALAQTQATRETARLNLGYTVLRAPIDGSIGNRRARNGAYAAAGSQLLSLVPAHGLWIDANFKESQLAGMQAGSACASPPTCCQAMSSTAPWPAWRPPPAPSSACCPLKMRPATSPRSSSACRCASRSTPRTPPWAPCVRACRSVRKSTCVPSRLR